MTLQMYEMTFNELPFQVDQKMGTGLPQLEHRQPATGAIRVRADQDVLSTQTNSSSSEPLAVIQNWDTVRGCA